MSFNISNSASGFKIDLGESVGYFNLQGGEKVESISVDPSIDDTKLCITRERRGRKIVNIFTLSDYKLEEVSELLFHLINLSRPDTVCIDTFGAGIAVKDFLYPRLLGKGSIVAPSGKVNYEVDEIYGRLLNK